MQPTRTSLVLTAVAVLALACNPPKSRTSKAKPKAATNTAAASPASGTAGVTSPGGAELPADTPRNVLVHIDGLATSPRGHTASLVAIGSDASPAMAALGKSENIAEASSAMRFFAATGYSDGAAAAARLVEHPVPSLRHLALIALSRCGTVTQLPALESALTHKTDATTRSLAIRAVASFGAPESADRLIRLLDDSAEQVTTEVAAALKAVGQRSPSIASMLATKAGSPEVATALGALTALRLLKLGDGLRHSDLQKPLAHANEHVVAAALRLAPRVSWQDAQGAMTKLALSALADSRVSLRRVALEHLEHFALPSPMTSAKALLSDPDPEVSAAAAAAVGRLLAADRRLSQLLPLLSHPHAATRQSTIIALAQAGPKAVKPLIARLALERDPMTRVFIARSLGKLKASESIDALIGILEDADARAPQKLQARDSLRGITGQSLSIDAEKWRSWMANAQKTGG